MKLNKPVFVIGKRADNLVEALKESPRTITVWVRSGRFKNKFPIIRSAVVYEAKSNVDAKDYVKKFVAVLSFPKTHTKLSVLRGITPERITQLLAFTKRDRLIRTQTHDFDRFKSKKSFSSWEKRGKTIYTLVSRNGGLAGIIWFGKKPFKNYKFTFAIRVYPPARGKGLSKKFMELVIDNFSKNHKKPSFWLKTAKGNARALKLYRRFGFKVIPAKEEYGEVVMTYKS
jgi:ribosomal protein S18 acetylase RimI-like enzyme